jgi:hypothetical protein
VANDYCSHNHFIFTIGSRQDVPNFSPLSASLSTPKVIKTQTKKQFETQEIWNFLLALAHFWLEPVDWLGFVVQRASCLPLKKWWKKKNIESMKLGREHFPQKL